MTPKMRVDQRQRVSWGLPSTEWPTLGTWHLSRGPGTSITVSDDADRYVAAYPLGLERVA